MEHPRAAKDLPVREHRLTPTCRNGSRTRRCRCFISFEERTSISARWFVKYILIYELPPVPPRAALWWTYRFLGAVSSDAVKAVLATIKVATRRHRGLIVHSHRSEVVTVPLLFMSACLPICMLRSLYFSKSRPKASHL